MILNEESLIGMELRSISELHRLNSRRNNRETYNVIVWFRKCLSMYSKLSINCLRVVGQCFVSGDEASFDLREAGCDGDERSFQNTIGNQGIGLDRYCNIAR